MVTAKEYIRELRTRKVLSERHIAVIEQSLLQPAEEIPAGDLANYLVEQMIVSAAVSNAILSHLHEGQSESTPKREDVGGDSELRLLDEDSIVNLKPASKPVPTPQRESAATHHVAPPMGQSPKTVPVPKPKTQDETSPKPQPPPVTPPPKPSRPMPPQSTPPQPPLPPEPKPPKPRKPSTSSLDELFEGETRAGELPDDAGGVSLPRPLKEGSWRIKRRENAWDTPLVKYGIISLGLLLLLCVVLVWLLTQRRADEVMALADEAYQNGSYAQAIDGYNDFIKAFENNANVPRAKLRISLARIRLITETKSNWDKALDAVLEELPKMSQLPDFASEGRTELSAMLPNIAEGLAALAEKNNDAKSIARSEKALELVEEHVPNSLRPFNQLQSTRRTLELARRRIASEERIVAMRAEVTGLLDQIKANASNDDETIRQNLAECHAIVTRYLHSHPEMQNDPVIAAARSDIARTEAACQKWVAFDPNAGPSDQPATAQKEIRPMPIMLLSSHTGATVSGMNAPGENTASGMSAVPFLCYADENLYGIDPATGAIRWHCHVGRPGFDRASPLIISGLPEGNAILADEKNRSLVMLDTSSGTERYRLTLGEPFFVNPQPMWPIAFVTTQSGKLFVVDLAAGKQLGYLDLAQGTDAPPCYDHQNRLIVQAAHQSALHVLRYDAEAIEPLVNVGIVPTGHLPGTILTAPVVHQGHMIVAEQTAPMRSTIKIFAPIEPDRAVPWGDEPVQSVPFDGLIKMPPIVSGNDLLYMAERGDIKMISYIGSEPAKPYQVVAEGRIDETLKRGEAVSGRYAALAGRSLWVSDNRLQRLEIQPSRSRFIAQETPLTPPIMTQSPLQVIDGHLLQAYVNTNLGGNIVRSVSLSDLAVPWQTGFGETVHTQPFVPTNHDALHIVTQNGKLYDIPLADLTQQRDRPLYDTQPYLSQVAGGGSTEPVTNLVRLESGLEVLCSVPVDVTMAHTPATSIFRVYDGNAPQSQVRTHIIPASLTSPGVPFGQGIALPLSNGQIALFSAVDGTVIANPFVTKRTQNPPPKWSPLTVIPKNAIEKLLDNTSATSDDETLAAAGSDTAILVGDDDGLLRQIELIPQNNRPTLTATRSVQLPCAITSQPLVCGRNVIVADDVGRLLLFDYGQLTPEGNRLVPEQTQSNASNQPDVATQTPTHAAVQPTMSTNDAGLSPAVNQAYGGVIVTGNVEPKNDSPFVIDTRAARAINEAPSETSNEASNETSETTTNQTSENNAGVTETADATAIASAESSEPNDAPYQAWELDGPVIWGPYPCNVGSPNGNDNTLATTQVVIAATDKNTWTVITQADQPVESRKTSLKEMPLEHGMPIGRPVALNESQMLFVTRKGVLVRFDFAQGTLTPLIETGVRPVCGPILAGAKIILIGDGGALYTF